MFCARLLKNKALPFLVDACRAARAKFGDFTLVLIGDGHYGPWLREQAEKEAWIRPVGSLYGTEKAELLAVSDVFLLPSMVGLSILDSFAAGLPLLSARFNNHSPEIAYLKDDVNGLMTDATVDAYSDAIVRVLSDEGLRKALSAGARQSADVYSVDAMIENFTQGIWSPGILGVDELEVNVPEPLANGVHVEVSFHPGDHPFRPKAPELLIPSR